MERGPLREGSSSWKQLAEAGKNVEIPEDFQSWAGSTSLILEKADDVVDSANGSSEAASVEEEMETTQVS